MGTLHELKKTMRLDKDLRPMLVRSTLHEALLDLDGDKMADIALIDNNRDGDIDMIGIDLTGNGEFNLYVGDADGNGIIDTVEFYEDGDDMPVAAYMGRNVEERFLDLAGMVYGRILAREVIAAELIAAFEEFAARAEEEYEKLQKESEAASTEKETPEEPNAEAAPEEEKESGAPVAAEE